MVVLLDLEHEADEDDSSRQQDITLDQQLSGLQHLRIYHHAVERVIVESTSTSTFDRWPPLVDTRNAVLLASALACYPVALSLASYLDLNDLFALSSTCRSVHAALAQFAHHLRLESLQCVNDQSCSITRLKKEAVAISDTFKQVVAEQGYDMEMIEQPLHPSLPVLQPSSTYYHGGVSSALGLTGKVSKCARDFVAPCRKCGIVVCRNCAVKPPSARLYAGRFRRLCQTCLEAPIKEHLGSLLEGLEIHDNGPPSGASSFRSSRSFSSGSVLSQASTEDDHTAGPAFTTPAFLRTPCECDSRGVFLCQPCGQNLASADTTYKRVWTWRSRYSTHIGGGLGTGLGQGEQGQKCGRGDYCLEKSAAGVCWVEIDCSDARGQGRGRPDFLSGSRSSTPVTSDLESEHIRNTPGYLSQEIEGIGGVVKKKVKKRIKVGATVYEYEDERESGNYLERESSGRVRSWCGWCFRVCPATAERSSVMKMVHSHS